ncbi:hypothetical protein BJ508DRAFT_367085 [Ascobolus immersus RN42]|uniref:Mid2 domain-containing protein n=1 Tax=Ascobolus immersus RN42 TaxID=1160509 RepID=A0A3N4HKT9_ASCIM|nr:hypothetical protein BJ508DRAFT_367085 [Ascobolus immersus RN42]
MKSVPINSVVAHLKDHITSKPYGGGVGSEFRKQGMATSTALGGNGEASGASQPTGLSVGNGFGWKTISQRPASTSVPDAIQSELDSGIGIHQTWKTITKDGSVTESLVFELHATSGVSQASPYLDKVFGPGPTGDTPAAPKAAAGTPSSTGKSSETSTSGFSKSIVIGASVGASLGTLALVLVVILLYKRHKRKKSNSTGESETDEDAPAVVVQEKHFFAFWRGRQTEAIEEMEDTGRKELADTARAELEGSKVVHELPASSS